MKIMLISFVLIISSHAAFAVELCPKNETELPDVYVQDEADIDVRPGSTVSAEILSIMVKQNCFGTAADYAPFTKQLLQKIQDATNVSDNLLEFKTIVDGMLVDLIAYGEQQAKMAQSIETSQVWVAFIHQLNAVLLTRDASQVDFTVDHDDLKSNLVVSYSGLSLVSRNCPYIWQGAKCIQAVKETGRLFRGLVLAERVIRVANLPQLNKELKLVKGRLEGFKNYYKKAEPLWPWEPWFNTNVVTANDVIRNGNLQGFRDPVEYQWLVLHPSTALHYVPEQDDHFKPAVIVDVFGYNKLDWENNGSELTSYGASAIVSLSAFNGKTNVGWGLRFFYNRTYSFGITKNSDQIGLFISVGAVEKFNTWNEKEDDFIKMFDEISHQF